MEIAIGIAVGLILGLTGAGGSTLAVPLLMWTLGWSLPQAAPVALIAVSAVAALGTVVAWRQARLRYRAGLLMGISGIATAPIGLALAQRLPHAVLELLFVAIMVVVAIRMLLRASTAPLESLAVRGHVGGDEADRAVPCQVDPATGRIEWTLRCGSILAALGGLTGLLSGLLGVGGGFVIVPGLRAATDLSMSAAVATSLMVIAIVSGGTVASHVTGGGILPIAVALPFAGGALAGMTAGLVIAPRVAGPMLQRAFAVSMLTAAAVMLVRVVGR